MLVAWHLGVCVREYVWVCVSVRMHYIRMCVLRGGNTFNKWKCFLLFDHQHKNRHQHRHHGVHHCVLCSSSSTTLISAETIISVKLSQTGSFLSYVCVCVSAHKTLYVNVFKIVLTPLICFYFLLGFGFAANKVVEKVVAVLVLVFNLKLNQQQTTIWNCVFEYCIFLYG